MPYTTEKSQDGKFEEREVKLMYIIERHETIKQRIRITSENM